MSARADILAALRNPRPVAKNLYAEAPEGSAAPSDVVSGTEQNSLPDHITPDRTRGDAALLRQRFQTFAEASAASVDRAPSLQAVPGLIKQYLSATGLPLVLRRAPSPWLDLIPWRSEPELSVTSGLATESDHIGVTTAAMAVAETGSLVLLSGPAHPTLMAFLPETHIVVLPLTRLVGGLEDVWLRLRSHFGVRWPSSVTFVTGPSRSADIEQTLQLGAHGPRRLHVILTDEPAD